MDITRVNRFDDPRFSDNVLAQHGCFLIDEEPYEVEILSEYEAVVRGKDASRFSALIDEYRFYTPQVTRFLDINGALIKEFPKAEIIEIAIEKIQPSQFYADKRKIDAISTFIQKPDDIIIQAMPYEGKFVSLDGHTRLYYAVMNGWTYVRAVIETAHESILGFVDEARKRGILTPFDIIPIEHEEYEILWNKFCDDYFAQSGD